MAWTCRSHPILLCDLSVYGKPVQASSSEFGNAGSLEKQVEKAVAGDMLWVVGDIGNVVTVQATVQRGALCSRIGEIFSAQCDETDVVIPRSTFFTNWEGGHLRASSASHSNDPPTGVHCSSRIALPSLGTWTAASNEPQQAASLKPPQLLNAL